MNISYYVDDRQDPIKSTEAACRYLEYLYGIFNDWQLAIAAYNGGPTEVKKAIVRSGGKTNFWQIKHFLPAETQGYVPAFIAMTYIMNYATEHNIYSTSPKISYYQIDTVQINKPVYFHKISEILNIPIDTLKFLNPSFKYNYIPKLPNPVILTLPTNKIPEFLKNTDQIFNSEVNKNKPANIKKIYTTKGKTKIVHIVEKGEYFNKIALKYKCSVDEIKSWNNLTSKNLHVGQKLDIWVVPAISVKKYINKS